MVLIILSLAIYIGILSVKVNNYYSKIYLVLAVDFTIIFVYTLFINYRLNRSVAVVKALNQGENEEILNQDLERDEKKL
jgi:hypothetical protein